MFSRSVTPRGEDKARADQSKDIDHVVAEVLKSCPFPNGVHPDGNSSALLVTAQVH